MHLRDWFLDGFWQARRWQFYILCTTIIDKIRPLACKKWTLWFILIMLIWKFIFPMIHVFCKTTPLTNAMIVFLWMNVGDIFHSCWECPLGCSNGWHHWTVYEHAENGHQCQNPSSHYTWWWVVSDSRVITLPFQARVMCKFKFIHCSLFSSFHCSQRSSLQLHFLGHLTESNSRESTCTHMLSSWASSCIWKPWVTKVEIYQWTNLLHFKSWI